MSFKKQVLVLKDVSEQNLPSCKPLTGIARIEIDGGIAQLFLSLINTPSQLGGEFFALVVDGHKQSHFFSLGTRPVSTIKVFESAPSIDCGVAIGIFLVKNSLPTLLAFSRTSEKDCSITQFKKIIADKQLEHFKHKRKTQTLSEKESINDVIYQPTVTQPEITSTEQFKKLENSICYDDEAVATENYYQYDCQPQKKLDQIKDFEQNVSNKDVLSSSPSPQKTHQEQPIANSAKNETDAHSSQNNANPVAYYEQVKRELTEIFEKFPQEPTLQKLFHKSKWAKIYYSKEKYYVVGVIMENEREKFICYGVPGVYSPTPPEQLKGFCSFVPASIFNMTGAGYWMLFQDAFSGKCVLHK